MTDAGKRPILDANESADLQPEVVEFCHMLARIFARGTCRPLHNRDSCVPEPEDDPGRTSAD